MLRLATNSKLDRKIREFLGTDMLDDGDSLAEMAIKRYLGHQVATSLNRVSQGFSGGSVYRCSTASGSFALKCWPAETPPERVDEVHRVQRFACERMRNKQLGLGKSSHSLIPELSDLGGTRFRLTLADRHFDLSTWLPGAAFPESSATTIAVGGALLPISMISAVEAGAAAIASFHQRTLDLGADFSPAPAVIRRLKRLEELRRELPLALAKSSQMTGPAKVAAEYLTRNWRQLHRDSESLLKAWLVTQVRLQWVLRDVHREHVLFLDGDVSGIVDFDAIRRDTVATDLARWVGSFAESGVQPAILWDAALAGYGSVGEISPCEQRLSGAIEQASWYIHLANWVTWIADESREVPGGIVAAQGRVTALLRRSDVRFST